MLYVTVITQEVQELSNMAEKLPDPRMTPGDEINKKCNKRKLSEKEQENNIPGRSYFLWFIMNFTVFVIYR